MDRLRGRAVQGPGGDRAVKALAAAALGIAACVFLETTRDQFVEENQVAGADERAVVVHEIGHTLGANDITVGRDTAGVMYYEVPLPETWFNDNSLYEIREKTHE